MCLAAETELLASQEIWGSCNPYMCMVWGSEDLFPIHHIKRKKKGAAGARGRGKGD